MAIEQARALLYTIHHTNRWRYPLDLDKGLIVWPSPQDNPHVTVWIYDRERPVQLTFDTRIAWLLHRLALLPEPVGLPPETAATIADLERQVMACLDEATRLVQQLLQLRPRS